MFAIKERLAEEAQQNIVDELDHLFDETFEERSKEIRDVQRARKLRRSGVFKLGFKKTTSIKHLLIKDSFALVARKNQLQRLQAELEKAQRQAEMNASVARRPPRPAPQPVLCERGSP